MTMTVRKQLSLAAWVGAGFCSLLLLVAASSAAQHYNELRSKEDAKNYTVTAPVLSAPN